ncbi:glycoside hydrolase family 6 protein [Actinomadura sp. 6K520]|uniref:glycoside hydrolase family 6 protein n=1 Tax=Actinomadura sp. 6K520 TaxID=2530364 RepID=UPI00104A6455|nr:glycoside hydrolase family 6 protein [Actinomadura sp. 6K520]TDE20499.1 cellulose 1,4-beta-cellobiosidase [Actinomadura sp. 6K520]
MKTPTARRRHGPRRGLAAASAALLLASGTVALAQTQASAAPGCKVDYTTNDWGSGFTANVAVTNLGDPITGGWTLEWDFTGNQQVTSGWNGTFAQSGGHVTVTGPSWSGTLGTGATVTPGFQATYSGTNAAPAQFTLNGVVCDGTTGPTDPPTTDPPTDPPGDRVDNPYAGADVYVNPEWSANAASEPGGSAVADEPTGVWMDRIAAIEGAGGRMGLRDHLDEALDQGADTIQVVVYNLPGRDCAALASNGELGPEEIGKYKTDFIDPIAEILGDDAYADLRIVTVVEIDSLPNLITNVGTGDVATENCNEMLENGNYQEGIAYALQQLGAIPNVYNYIDIGHHGWLGWDDNFGSSADLLTEVAQQSGSLGNVAGFITNTANYGALKEPHFTIDDSVNGTSVRQSTWIDWNRYVDELSYAQAYRQELIGNGFGQDIGMLIDTSRNGWGGPERPAGPGPTTDVNAYVDGGRTDRRIHLGNWCNQAGAGLGERPTANPEPGIDAYVWIKPPGESDGASEEIPNDEGKGFDEMCDPAYEGNPRNGDNPSGALPDAPISGHWFSAQFRELLANANPPVQ